MIDLGSVWLRPMVSIPLNADLGFSGFIRISQDVVPPNESETDKGQLNPIRANDQNDSFYVDQM
jgi:hypothetical protein